MKKTLTVFAICAIIGLFALNGFSQPFRERPGIRDRLHESPARILRVLKAHQEDLKITEDQLKAIEDLTYSFEEKAIEAKGEASKQRLELKKLMQDRENLDYAKIKATLSKASAHRNDMFIEALKLKDEIARVLTPEQKEALKSMRQERLKDRREFMRRDRERERMPRSRWKENQ